MTTRTGLTILRYHSAHGPASLHAGRTCADVPPTSPLTAWQLFEAIAVGLLARVRLLQREARPADDCLLWRPSCALEVQRTAQSLARALGDSLPGVRPAVEVAHAIQAHDREATGLGEVESAPRAEPRSWPAATAPAAAPHPAD